MARGIGYFDKKNMIYSAYVALRINTHIIKGAAIIYSLLETTCLYESNAKFLRPQTETHYFFPSF